MRERGGWCALLVLALAPVVTCGGDAGGADVGATRPTPSRTRPSIALVVLDTVRADAVSAYGHVRGTTAVLDALAATGLRYQSAYANASWTLPSHVSLFTGLLPSAHGVGWRHTRVPDRLDTLAEWLAAAGYETVGISENPWVSGEFGLAQGFERFTVTRGGRTTRAALDDWLAARDASRPFFLFVNVIDAHAPYKIGPRADLLPPGVTVAAARKLSQKPADYMCRWDPTAASARILRGMYLADVASADRKLGQLLSRLNEADLTTGLVIAVTSDHGEYFGEHGLAQHLVGLHEPIIHVPLVVHGAPGVSTATIATPVQLVDLSASILSWAGVTPPPGIAGVPLPQREPTGATAAARTIVAEWYDPAGSTVGEDASFAGAARLWTERARAHCGPEDRVFGVMRALIRGTSCLLWYDRHPPTLFDLATDPGQRRDLAADRPEEVRRLTAALRHETAAADVPDAEPAPERPIDAGILKRLRDLGYVGDDDVPDE